MQNLFIAEEFRLVSVVLYLCFFLFTEHVNINWYWLDLDFYGFDYIGYNFDIV